MPQKRNPDAAELVRAKIGRIAGAFQALLMVMKGLPLAYSKDMQEDKEATFDAIRDLALALAAMPAWSTTWSRSRRPCGPRPGGGYSTATDLADWLVRVLAMPFRDAHHVTGRLVAAAEAKKLPLDKLPLEAMRAVEPRITADVFSVLSPEKSASSRVSYGGTAPQNVLKMARPGGSGWKRRLQSAKNAGLPGARPCATARGTGARGAFH